MIVYILYISLPFYFTISLIYPLLVWKYISFRQILSVGHYLLSDYLGFNLLMTQPDCLSKL